MPPETCISQIHYDDLLLCGPSRESDRKLQSVMNEGPLGLEQHLLPPTDHIEMKQMLVNAH